MKYLKLYNDINLYNDKNLYNNIFPNLSQNLKNSNIIIKDNNTDNIFYNNISKIEYIESDNTQQYINTNIINNNSVKLTIVMSMEGADCLSGTEPDIGSKFKCGTDGNGYIFYGYINNYVSNIIADINTKYIYYLSYGEQYVKDENNNIIKSSSGRVGNYAAYPILLCRLYLATNNPPYIEHNGRIRIYSCNIKYGDNEEINLIPIRINLTGYLYDTIHKRLYENAGPGLFILGPDIEDIIE